MRCKFKLTRIGIASIVLAFFFAACEKLPQVEAVDNHLYSLSINDKQHINSLVSLFEEHIRSIGFQANDEYNSGANVKSYVKPADCEVQIMTSENIVKFYIYPLDDSNDIRSLRKKLNRRLIAFNQSLSN